MSAIYEPKGRALEYSYLACNLFRGCVHGCLYCYAPDVLRIDKKDFHSISRPRPNVLSQLKKDAIKLKGTNKRVLLCFTCDPYPPENMENGITREALQILKGNNIPFQILTKAGTKASRDFDLYGPNDAFATTLTYLSDDGKTLEIEPGAALPSDRIQTIREAKKKGITTWVSLEPVLDAEESLAIIEQTHRFVDLFKIGKLNHKRSDIDWGKFGAEAVRLCERYNTPYYIKNDLAAFMNGIAFTNTDTRILNQNDSHS